MFTILNFIYIIWFYFTRTSIHQRFQSIKFSQSNHKRNPNNPQLHKFDYQLNKSVNCNQYDLIGRTQLRGKLFENRLELRKWLIVPNISCISSQINPFGLIGIFSHWSNNWNRKFVCEFSIHLYNGIIKPTIRTKGLDNNLHSNFLNLKNKTKYKEYRNFQIKL